MKTNKKQLRCFYKKYALGVTILELVITMTISLILILVVGVLLVGGQRIWNQTYASAHSQIKLDAQAVMIEFGSTGRKSNRINYKLYNKSGNVFTPAVTQTSNPEEVVKGDAVEFRYWDVELTAGDPYDLMDTTKTATAYKLFYIDGDELKVDSGTYPPGGVPNGGGPKSSAGVSTRTIAENVSYNPAAGVFSHTTLNGVGQGCVRINITLTDPTTNDSINVMTGTMLRNIWPR